jgi:hypothetical protein
MMSWQRRLMELACAGGTLAGGCMESSNQEFIFPCGNGNPDPCICNRTPDPEHSPQCIAENTCKANGGSWALFDSSPLPTVDAGSQLFGHCEGYPKDAGVDAPRTIGDATVPGD